MSDKYRKEYLKKYYQTVVKKKIKKHKNPKRKFSQIDIDNIINRYISGESSYKIAEAYLVDKGRIRRILVKNNIVFRNCREGYKDITGTKWSSIKYNAKIRNLDFQITIEEAWELFIKQERKCALTGDILVFAIDTKEMLDNVTTASLDRIDSSKGYTIDNVQWVHKNVNLMKRELNQQDFIDICNKVSHYNKER